MYCWYTVILFEMFLYFVLHLLLLFYAYVFIMRLVNELSLLCVKEKRRGDTTTSHKAKSSKEVDYSEKLSKPEPKFEPRISMYKYDPLQGVSRSLTLWRPLLPYGYSYKASCDRVKPYVICNFWHRALWRSTQASECPDVKNYKWVMTV